MNYEKNDPSRSSDTNANRDPISGAPGAHPIGTGVGAVVGGAAAGAAAGTVVGPVGTVVGAAVGAIVGGLAGKGVAEVIDPTSEEAYWRDNFKGRPYVENATSFDDYGPAYGYGVSSYAKYPGRSFDDVEADLSRDWDGARGASQLQWNQARNATRDAWERIGNR
ncbi:hypothetical protein [Aromatoleum diolicum]|uniref:Glycine zipper domain-containing protein n=1 Tax=Aromatoleum diolicum TaxID=75796 RepID=A0ABX1QFR6_9RHOO|nr:hypothetical protein [Aromatoleum diolicum]NMG76246.1 hypothetical protein [Aromatoleum diolicum]